jgi:CheY-like chemotaxis protein
MKGLAIVIDDSAAHRINLELLLKKLNYQVLSFENGTKALKHLQASNTSPALVLSDLMMPEISGFDVLKKIRTMDYLKDTPFILITAAMDRGLILEAKELSVDGYILKPVTLEKLSEKIASTSSPQMTQN